MVNITDKIFFPTNSSVFGKEDLNYNKGLATDYTDLHGLICMNYFVMNYHEFLRLRPDDFKVRGNSWNSWQNLLGVMVIENYIFSQFLNHACPSATAQK